MYRVIFFRSVGTGELKDYFGAARMLGDEVCDVIYISI